MVFKTIHIKQIVQTQWLYCPVTIISNYSGTFSLPISFITDYLIAASCNKGSDDRYIQFIIKESLQSISIRFRSNASMDVIMVGF